MKKILFISTRNPYSNRYSGDVIGSKKILSILKKNNSLDLVTLDEKEDFSQKRTFIFEKPNFILKFFYIIRSLFYFQPIQFGLFYLFILSFITWFAAYMLFKKGYKIKS